MILLLRRLSSYNAGRFTFFSSPAMIEHLLRFSSPNGFILLLNSITYRGHISKLHFHRPIVINLSVLFGSKAMKSRITNDRNNVSVSPVNELELLKQECMLQKELLQLGEQKQKINEDLLLFQADIKQSFNERINFQSKHVSKDETLRQLLTEERNIKEQLNMMEEELAYFKEENKQQTIRLDFFKIKHMTIDHQIIINEEGQENTFGKRCKLFASGADASLLKFSFEEVKGGYLIHKISREVGFTILSHEIAFPSQGTYHFIFQVRQIYENDFAIGIKIDNTVNNSQANAQLIYFNFANGTIQYNNKVIREFECDLYRGSIIVFVMDMNLKRMICCVDQTMQELLLLQPFGLGEKPLFLFLAMSSHEQPEIISREGSYTVIYFSNQ